MESVFDLLFLGVGVESITKLLQLGIKHSLKTLVNGFKSMKSELARLSGWVQFFNLLLNRVEFVVQNLDLSSEQVLSLSLHRKNFVERKLTEMGRDYEKLFINVGKEMSTVWLQMDQ